MSFFTRLDSDFSRIFDTGGDCFAFLILIHGLFREVPAARASCQLLLVKGAGQRSAAIPPHPAG
jgi:hypothetical protein